MICSGRCGGATTVVQRRSAPRRGLPPSAPTRYCHGCARLAPAPTACSTKAPPPFAASVLAAGGGANHGMPGPAAWPASLGGRLDGAPTAQQVDHDDDQGDHEQDVDE